MQTEWSSREVITDRNLQLKEGQFLAQKEETYFLAYSIISIGFYA